MKFLKKSKEFGILRVMGNNKSAGFEEVSHTADLEIRVWAKDLESLFRQSAAGMVHLSGVEELMEGISSVKQTISLEAMDYEGLLILFLEELLYRLTEDYMIYDIKKLSITSDYALKANLKGSQIKSYQRDIKAVTYHNLNISTTADGYEVQIVFDI
jgi:SHS2 domain-containing protein